MGIMLLAACSKSSQEENQLTFADIEKEFGFDNPHTDFSKELILDIPDHVDPLKSGSGNKVFPA
ncbi:hypothetical protein [Labilibaculum sp.]|uniref:hypothetical protein n=1 Tax=Labilibaculum sp. TaxID=2060723 RepID=UPI002AA5E6CD|nr:hypothetical protein [Labilibaculum sp.]